MTAFSDKSIAVVAVLLLALAACDSGGGSVSLEAPLLLGPADNTDFPALSIVELSWSRVDGAVAYEYSVEYDDYPSASTSGVVVDTFHVEQFSELGSVRWRVRARAEEGPGPWSTPRQLEVYGTRAPVTSDFAFQFNTTGVTIGDRIATAADRAFASDLLAAIQAIGAEAADLRQIIVDAFRLTISSPVGTTMGQFSEWRLFLKRGGATTAIVALSDPAPTLESVDLVFQQPDEWLTLAIQPDTELELTVQLDTRSPRSVVVSVDVNLEMTAVLNR